jgi:uncharacterized protein (TIGR03435 family)
MKHHFGLTIGAGLLCFAGAALPQTGPRAFEVATVRPSAPLDMAKLQAAALQGQMPRLGMIVNPGRVEFLYVDLKTLISIAYKLKPYQVAGPDWMATQRFDIVAKFPTGATRDDIPQMLQALLKERLKLQAHIENKEQPVLALVVGKGGPKLTVSKEAPAALDDKVPLKPGETKMDSPDGEMRMRADPKTGQATLNMGAKGVMTYRMNPATRAFHIDASQMTMAGFVEMLTQFSQMGGGNGRQVVDMTGLKEHYDLAMDIPLDELLNIARAAGVDVPAAPGAAGGSGVLGASDPGGGRSVLSSVEAFGLKLEPRKAVIERLVVDSVEKTPTEN